jgi:hypothetical protein
MDDEALLGYLRQALLGQRPPPSGVVALAKASFGLRRLDAELAALVADSLDDTTGPRVRTVGAPRIVSFESADLTVEVELAPTGTGWRLIGQLDPPEPARIELRRPTGVSPGSVDADRRGRFALDVAESGPVSLLCHRLDRPPVATTWVLLG